MVTPNSRIWHQNRVQLQATFLVDPWRIDRSIDPWRCTCLFWGRLWGMFFIEGGTQFMAVWCPKFHEHRSGQAILGRSFGLFRLFCNWCSDSFQACKSTDMFLVYLLCIFICSICFLYISTVATMSFKPCVATISRLSIYLGIGCSCCFMSHELVVKWTRRFVSHWSVCRYTYLIYTRLSFSSLSLFIIF